MMWLTLNNPMVNQNVPRHLFGMHKRLLGQNAECSRRAEVCCHNRHLNVHRTWKSQKSFSLAAAFKACRTSRNPPVSRGCWSVICVWESSWSRQQRFLLTSSKKPTHQPHHCSFHNFPESAALSCVHSLGESGDKWNGSLISIQPLVKFASFCLLAS